MDSTNGLANGDVPENLRLFIGGLPVMKTRSEIVKELDKTGVPGVKNVIMYKSYSQENRNRGYVFVEFTDHMTASTVLDCFRGVLHLFGKKVFMDWANPATKVQSGAMEEVRILFIRGIPLTMTKEWFKTILSTIVRNTAFEKIFKDQGHAFIHFFTRRAAEQAMILLQEAMCSQYSHLQWEIKWAIPQEKILTGQSLYKSCPICQERRWSETVSSVVSWGCVF